MEAPKRGLGPGQRSIPRQDQPTPVQRVLHDANASRFHGLGGRGGLLRTVRTLPQHGVKDELILRTDDTLWRWDDTPTAPQWRQLTSGAAGVHNVLSATHGDSLAGSPTRGSIIVSNATPRWSKLALGSSGQFLRSDGSDAVWGPILSSEIAHAVLSSVHSDVTPAVKARGDILIVDSTPLWVRLPIGTAGKVLTSDGTDVSWAATVAGVTDHGLLDAPSLLDDDHVGYARLAGRAGGQILQGGTAAADLLDLRASTSTTQGRFLLRGNTVPQIELYGTRTQFMTANADMRNSIAVRMMQFGAAGPGNIPFMGINAPASTSFRLLIAENAVIAGAAALLRFTLDSAVGAPLGSGAPIRLMDLGASSGGLDLAGYSVEQVQALSIAPQITDLVGGGALGNFIGIRLAGVLGMTPTSGAAIDIESWFGNGIRQRETALFNRFAGRTTFGADADPATSAAIDIRGTLGALLLSRLDNTQQGALTADNGMLVYNTDTGKLTARENGAWVDYATGTSLAHNFLSSSHSDALAATVVEGDVLVGNATPKWSRLARTVPASGLRNVLGLDNGDTIPSWKALLDTTDPANIATTAAPGTSLIAARRDHVHANTLGAMVLFTQSVEKTVANNAAETTLLGTLVGSNTIPANWWTVGRTLRFTAWGHMATVGTASQTMRLRAYMGATSMASTQVIGFNTAEVAFTWKFESTITCKSTGSSGEVYIQGVWMIQDSPTGGVSNALWTHMTQTSVLSLDTTVSKDFDLTADWNSAVAGDTITCKIATLEALGG